MQGKRDISGAGILRVFLGKNGLVAFMWRVTGCMCGPPLLCGLKADIYAALHVYALHTLCISREHPVGLLFRQLSGKNCRTFLSDVEIKKNKKAKLFSLRSALHTAAAKTLSASHWFWRPCPGNTLFIVIAESPEFRKDIWLIARKQNERALYWIAGCTRCPVETSGRSPLLTWPRPQ